MKRVKVRVRDSNLNNNGNTNTKEINNNKVHLDKIKCLQISKLIFKITNNSPLIHPNHHKTI